MFQLFKKYIVFAAILFIAIFLLFRLDIFPSWDKWFSSSPLKIDETPVLIKEINALAELATISAHDEVVVDSVIIDPTTLALRTITGISTNPFGSLYSKLVLVAKGQVICGTNFKGMPDTAVKIFRDSVSIVLPRAEILDIIINPSGFETFIEEGKWSNEAVTGVKIKAREKMKLRALRQGILEKANLRTILLMTNMLQAMGYKKLSVVIQT